MHMVRYRRNQQILTQVPLPADGFHAVAGHRPVGRRQRLSEGRELLSEPEAKRILAAYGVPVVETRIASTVDEAVALAERSGCPSR